MTASAVTAEATVYMSSMSSDLASAGGEVLSAIEFLTSVRRRLDVSDPYNIAGQIMFHHAFWERVVDDCELLLARVPRLPRAHLWAAEVGRAASRALEYTMLGMGGFRVLTSDLLPEHFYIPGSRAMPEPPDLDGLFELTLRHYRAALTRMVDRPDPVINYLICLMAPNYLNCLCMQLVRSVIRTWRAADASFTVPRQSDFLVYHLDAEVIGREVMEQSLVDEIGGLMQHMLDALLPSRSHAALHYFALVEAYLVLYMRDHAERALRIALSFIDADDVDAVRYAAQYRVLLRQRVH